MIALGVAALVCLTAYALGHQTVAALSLKWDRDRTVRAADSYRAANDAARQWDDQHGVNLRQVAVAERDVALRERVHADSLEAKRAPSREEPMPVELEARINSWDDEFARDAERSNITALYALHRDWQIVMSKLPALQPILTTDIAAPRDGLRDGMVQ